MATSNKRPSDHASEPPLKKPRFIDGMRETLQCPVCYNVEGTYFVLPTKQTVCGSCLDQLVTDWGRGKCPLTNQEFHREEVVESIGLKQVTMDYVTWETEQRRLETLEKITLKQFDAVGPTIQALYEGEAGHLLTNFPPFDAAVVEASESTLKLTGSVLESLVHCLDSDGALTILTRLAGLEWRTDAFDDDLQFAIREVKGYCTSPTWRCIVERMLEHYGPELKSWFRAGMRLKRRYAYNELCEVAATRAWVPRVVTLCERPIKRMAALLHVKEIKSQLKAKIDAAGGGPEPIEALVSICEEDAEVSPDLTLTPILKERLEAVAAYVTPSNLDTIVRLALFGGQGDKPHIESVLGVVQQCGRTVDASVLEQVLGASNAALSGAEKTLPIVSKHLPASAGLPIAGWQNLATVGPIDRLEGVLGQLCVTEENVVDVVKVLAIASPSQLDTIDRVAGDLKPDLKPAELPLCLEVVGALSDKLLFMEGMNAAIDKCQLTIDNNGYIYGQTKKLELSDTVLTRVRTEFGTAADTLSGMMKCVSTLVKTWPELRFTWYAEMEDMLRDREAIPRPETRRQLEKAWTNVHLRIRDANAGCLPHEVGSGFASLGPLRAALARGNELVSTVQQKRTSWYFKCFESLISDRLVALKDRAASTASLFAHKQREARSQRKEEEEVVVRV